MGRYGGGCTLLGRDRVGQIRAIENDESMF